MTKADLIRELAPYNDDTEVMIADDGTYFAIQSVLGDPDAQKPEQLILLEMLYHEEQT